MKLQNTNARVNLASLRHYIREHRKAKGSPVKSTRLRKVKDCWLLSTIFFLFLITSPYARSVGFYIVQDLSAGPWEGGVGPTVGFVFGRTAGFGRRAGGFSCTPILGATIGLKVLIVSLEELVLRRIWGSELLRATLCKGLRDSVDVAGVGEFFTCSKVSSTTSGACFAVLCLSSSRSSFKAVFIVSSISCWKRTRSERW